MSGGAQPLAYLWWLVSRASGILALVLLSVSVVLGLAMAAKVIRPPSLRPTIVKLHEHVALTALLAIGAHGLSLLGDHWLRPGVAGISVPFVMSYRPGFTGVGIIAGYMALLLGPTFYLRRRIGARRWRTLHRFIVVSWVLAAVHTVGSGSDAGHVWLRALVLLPVIPIAYLLVIRLLRPAPARAVPAARTPRRKDYGPSRNDGYASVTRIRA